MQEEILSYLRDTVGVLDATVISLADAMSFSHVFRTAAMVILRKWFLTSPELGQVIEKTIQTALFIILLIEAEASGNDTSENVRIDIPAHGTL